MVDFHTWSGSAPKTLHPAIFNPLSFTLSFRQLSQSEQSYCEKCSRSYF